MRTPHVLVVLALLTALLAGSPGAVASAPTCHGRAATIVSEGGVVRGTDGPDVVVSTGYLELRAGAGDDVVCASGPIDSIDAGSGDDLVDIRGNTARYAQVTLGSGADSFIGGPRGEMVWGAGELGASVDTEVDRFDTRGGDDQVFAGAADTPHGDWIRTGSGDDLVEVEGFYAGSHLDVGTGRNRLAVGRPTSGTQPWSVDVTARTVRQGPVAWSWQGLLVSFALGDDAAELGFVGSDADEEVILHVDGARADVDLGEGDDAVGVLGRPADGSAYALGPGRDALTLGNGDPDGTTWFEPYLRVDLSQQRLYYAPGVSAASVSGVETLSARALAVRVRGSQRAETLEASGCDVVVSGGAGRDLLRRRNGGLGHCPDVVSRLVGGPGADTLVGSSKIDDVLLGGRGRDVADGQAGIDRCVAEVERGCER